MRVLSEGYVNFLDDLAGYLFHYKEAHNATWASMAANTSLCPQTLSNLAYRVTRIPTSYTLWQISYMLNIRTVGLPRNAKKWRVLKKVLAKKSK
jgi:hypothetical protein